MSADERKEEAKPETKDAKEPWLNLMALFTVLLAVCATLSTFKGGSYSTQSVIAQAQASDQWAFFQAKSTKEHLHELHLEQIRLQLAALPGDSPARAAFEASIADNAAKVKQYHQEKGEIESKARAFEQARDAARSEGRPFGLAVIFLQVAILLNSIAGLLKARRVFYLAAPVGAIGFGLFGWGWFLALTT